MKSSVCRGFVLGLLGLAACGDSGSGGSGGTPTTGEGGQAVAGANAGGASEGGASGTGGGADLFQLCVEICERSVMCPKVLASDCDEDCAKAPTVCQSEYFDLLTCLDEEVDICKNGLCPDEAAALTACQAERAD